MRAGTNSYPQLYGVTSRQLLSQGQSILPTSDNFTHFRLVFESYLSELVVRKRLVEVRSEQRHVLLVAVGDVARRSNRELILGNGQPLRKSYLRARHGLSA